MNKENSIVGLWNRLNRWSQRSEGELGYVQEWKVAGEVYGGNKICVTVTEAEDGHILASAVADTIEEAVVAVEKKLPEAFASWSCPEYPGESKSRQLYPDVEVQLIGEDGNAFFIIGRVASALERAGVNQEKITEFQDEAMSGDYDNVLQTCMKWVTTY